MSTAIFSQHTLRLSDLQSWHSATGDCYFHALLDIIDVDFNPTL